MIAALEADGSNCETRLINGRERYIPVILQRIEHLAVRTS